MSSTLESNAPRAPSLELPPLEPPSLYAEPASSLDRLISAQVRFLDHRDLDWATVRRTRFFAYQRFQYVYPSLVLDLTQRLMVKPPNVHGDQRLEDFKLCVEPIPLTRRAHTDRFGNRVVKLEIARINNWTAFEVMFSVERDANRPVPIIPSVEARILENTTPLTRADARITETAQQLSSQSRSPLELAERICDWVSNAMTYRWGVTGVQTDASTALETGAGLCQDYAHVAIALSRAAGLPARYVSGHMLGEGGSHAWLEVLIPEGEGFKAIGFDPTNARRPNLGYTVVAVGRDYADVPPTSGRFTGSSAGKLEFEKHSGLLEVEFEDGTRLEANRAD
jgi:transglutaminase-like putative cysteine protease